MWSIIKHQVYSIHTEERENPAYCTDVHQSCKLTPRLYNKAEKITGCMCPATERHAADQWNSNVQAESQKWHVACNPSCAAFKAWFAWSSMRSFARIFACLNARMWAWLCLSVRSCVHVRVHRKLPVSDGATWAMLEPLKGFNYPALFLAWDTILSAHKALTRQGLRNHCERLFRLCQTNVRQEFICRMGLRHTSQQPFQQSRFITKHKCLWS